MMALLYEIGIFVCDLNTVKGEFKIARKWNLSIEISKYIEVMCFYENE